MAEFADIRAGIAANLRAYFPDAQVTGYRLANPTPPAFEVFLTEVEYDEAMARGHDVYRITVRGFVPAAVDIGAQKNLDVMSKSAGASSVKAALESDRTFGGSVLDSLVVSRGEEQIYGEGSYYGADWFLEAQAAGT